MAYSVPKRIKPWQLDNLIFKLPTQFCQNRRLQSAMQRSPCWDNFFYSNSRNNDDSRLGQADSNPYMAHIYPKNFTNPSAQSVTPHQQRESLYQMIQPPPPQQPQLIVTQSSNSPAVDPSTSGSNRTSTTFSEEAVTRFGETEESGSEQMWRRLCQL